jgi:hypothetical protein
VPFAFLNDHSKRKAAYDKKASKRGKDLQACKGEKSALSPKKLNYGANINLNCRRFTNAHRPE